MTAQQPGYDIEIQQLDPPPAVSIRATVQTHDLTAAMDERTTALVGYLQRSGAHSAGQPFVRYHTFGAADTDFDRGIPVVEPAVGEGQVVGGELPGGHAATTWHFGPHDTLAEAYACMYAR